MIFNRIYYGKQGKREQDAVVEGTLIPKNALFYAEGVKF